MRGGQATATDTAASTHTHAHTTTERKQSYKLRARNEERAGWVWLRTADCDLCPHPSPNSAGDRLAGRKGKREETLGSVWTEGTCRRSIRTMASNGSCNPARRHTQRALTNGRAGAVRGGCRVASIFRRAAYCRSYNRARGHSTSLRQVCCHMSKRAASEVDGGSSSAAILLLPTSWS